VRNAIARFDQVIDVSDADRALAFANIEKAANYYGVNLAETSWHDLGVHPQENRREAAAEGAETRDRRARSQESTGRRVGFRILVKGMPGVVSTIRQTNSEKNQGIVEGLLLAGSRGPTALGPAIVLYLKQINNTRPGVLASSISGFPRLTNREEKIPWQPRTHLPNSHMGTHVRSLVFESAVDHACPAVRFRWSSPDNRSMRRKLPTTYSKRRYRRYHCPIVLPPHLWLNRNRSRGLLVRPRKLFCKVEQTTSCVGTPEVE
jgi:hypothetical protein